MQTAQVPIWIPIVVGIIGLVGIIAGQLVNAWREDRRWKREQQRDEVRWQRERDYQNFTHWRDKKFEIYVDAIRALREWTRDTTAILAMDDLDEEGITQRLMPLTDNIRTVETRLAEIELIGDTSVFQQADTIFEALADLAGSITQAAKGNRPPTDQARDRISAIFKDTESLYRSIRTDLGLPD